MKFNDDITQSIAATVKDVLEGKATKKEEVKYPHDMFHPETGEKEVAKDEAEHKALSAKGYTHEKPKVNEVEEPNKPSGKLGQDSGERDFKAKHAIKKSGEKEDGTVVKEATDLKEDADLNEAVDKRKMAKLEKELDRAIDKVGKLFKQVPDELEDSESYQEMSQGLNNLEYGIRMFSSDVDDLAESKEMTDEESEKQKKYQAFFAKALKKFGVKSPSELEGDKKKEFFDYVDANYEADKEADESVKEETIEEATLKVTAYTGNMNPAKIKLKKGKANSYGGYDVTAVGSEKDLIAWAVRSLGVYKPKNFKDVQKQIDDMS